MQDNTTTIQIREDQRDALQERKQHDRESYKAVLDRLLADSDEQNGGEIDTEATQDIDAQEVAREVVDRLEGSKPLAEMEFEDWFEPDYAQTIATHIESEIVLSDVGVDYSPVLKRIDDLENTLPRKVAQEVSR